MAGAVKRRQDSPTAVYRRAVEQMTLPGILDAIGQENDAQRRAVLADARDFLTVRLRRQPYHHLAPWIEVSPGHYEREEVDNG